MRFLTAMLMAVLLESPQARTGAIEGVVIGANAGPIANARVAVWGDKGPDFETKTDANGYYFFGELPIGTYNMEVQAEGFLSEPDPSSDKRVRLSVNDQAPVRHDVTMMAAGIISGRIFDANREPLTGASVEILQITHNLQGRPVWQGVAAVKTDEKGEYRAEDVPAGDYYVRASDDRATRPQRGMGSPDIAATYFPGTADPRSAALIRVREGEEMSAVFSLGSEKTYSISGTVSQPDSDHADRSIMLYVVPQDLRIPLEPAIRSGVSIKNSVQGTWDFQVPGLLPGIYDLFAVALPYRRGRSTATVDPATGKIRYDFGPVEDVPGRVAKTTIQIRDSDLKDLRLSLDPGVDVTARIRGDTGSALDLTSQSERPQILLSLQRRDFVAGLLVMQSAIADRTDTLIFRGVPPGTYDVMFSRPGADSEVFLADVRENGRTVFDDGLTVGSSPVDFFEVLVGSNADAGTVEGRITGVGKSPVFVVLAPPPSRRQNGALFKTLTLSDSAQPFRFTGVAAGLYSVFAFEVATTSDAIAYRSPDFLSLHETEGMPVTVEKGTIAGPVQVRLISR